jgi:CHAT domain-containing protein/Tfp pilus assembly protein PilF
MPTRQQSSGFIASILCVLLLAGPAGAQTQEPAQPAPTEIGALEVGKSVEQSIKGGEAHRYTIRLEAGQFLKATVEQKGVDVAVALLGPDGKPVLEVDSPNGANGPEPVIAVGESGGVYMLEVKTLDPSDKGGNYEARVDEVRTATEKDRDLVEATKLYGDSAVMQSQGRSREALPVAARALELYEKAIGPEHPDLATPLLNLGDLYREAGAFAKAEPLYMRALALDERFSGPQHPNVATSLNNLARLYVEQGEYAKAEPLFVRSLAIAEKALGPEHPYVATSLHNLASLYVFESQYTKAEPFFRRALAIYEKVLGPEHPDVAGTLTSLALLYHDRGEYAKAESLYGRGLAIREKAFGPEHPTVGNSLANLGGLYRDGGQFAKAESFFVRALAIQEKVLGVEHPYVANALHNLAGLYVDQGKYEKAEPLSMRALAILERTFGPDHPDVATAVQNLANLYYDQGQYEKAEPLYVRSLTIREKALGPEHPDVGVSLNNLATLYRNQGQDAKVEPLLIRSLAIYEKSLGLSHQSTARALGNLAMYCAATGRVAEAVEGQSRANRVRERDLSRNLVAGSERAKLQYLEVSAGELDQTLSLQTRLAPRDPKALSMAMEIVLQRKGRGLDAMTDSIETLRRHAAPQDHALLDDLADARQQLARVTLAGSDRAQIELHRATLAALETRVEKLEAQVSSRSTEFRAVLAPVTLDSVRAAIPTDATLVEFVVYRPVDPKVLRDKPYGAPRYVAYVVSRNGEMSWADLGEAAQIDSAVAELRGALSDSKRRDTRQLARQLDELVMRPVRRLTGSTKHLLIAPDGALNLIPFAALVDERGRYLVEAHELTYLSSGRDLLRLAANSIPREKALVVADPAYGDAALAANADSREIMLKKAEAGAASVDFGVVRFAPLANTEAEAVALGALLPGSSVLTGEVATEAALKSAKAPKILHVATHGYFLPDLGVGEQRKIENPLLRSGLALAGANARKSGEDDGVLTALEVAGLDLWGTKLVVLSACETGVGEVKTGDGVYGLRRALVLAGSESQVISLWKVSDRATRDLMVAFYRGLLAGQGRTDALRRVQLQMLRTPATRHPFYWASFIQSGAWSPLDGKLP